MDRQTYAQEVRYLERTMRLLERRIREGLEVNRRAADTLDEQGRFLWEEIEAYYAEGERGFERLGEVLTGLEERGRLSDKAEHLTRSLRCWRRMLQAPYFARVDFREAPDSPTWEGDYTERVYIGRASLTDGVEDFVYDWRTPIASLFYRAVPGPASFEAPAGTISGEMTLKRQFQIKNGKLRLYVDTDRRVADELLAEALARHAAGKMHSVVETIQARQDEVIRDTDAEVLLVQGAAGSGKTAVALHRVAFLLYEGHAQKLSANDVLMLSPSALFGAYVADVLPELGEENLQTLLYDELLAKNLPEAQFRPRTAFLDRLTAADDDEAAAWDFFGSEAMLRILDRAVDRYAKHLFGFTDVLYDGKCVMDAGLQKAYLLNNPHRTPWGERLRRLASQLCDLADERQPARVRRIAELISVDPSRTDPMADARRLAAAELAAVHERIRRQLTMDPAALFHALMTDDRLFAMLSRDIDVPAGFAALRARCANPEAPLDFPAACALFYLQVRLFGAKGYERLRQLVIDEAQDLSPVQYAALFALAPHARITAVGDPAQSVSASAAGLADTLRRLTGSRRFAMVTLDRSYRSTAQITEFCNRLTDTPAAFFARDGEAPVIDEAPDEDAMFARLASALDGLEGLAAVVCYDEKSARETAARLPGSTLLTERSEQLRGTVVLPAALAKGLEFDSVFIPHAERYAGPRGRQALYVACTRALHRLSLYAAGPSPLLDTLRRTK